MIPAQAGIQLQVLAVVVVEVQTCHLARIKTVATAEATTTATTGESHVVRVIGIEHTRDARSAILVRTHQAARIAALRTRTKVGICEEAPVHARLDTEVQHGLLVTVVDTRHAGKIALLIVGTNIIDDVCRQVLHGCLCVTRHEFLTVNENLFNRLTIDGDLAVVIHLGTWQFLHQLLSNTTLRGTIGGCIIDEGIFLHRHLRGLGRCRYAFQHDCI